MRNRFRWLLLLPLVAGCAAAGFFGVNAIIGAKTKPQPETQSETESFTAGIITKPSEPLPELSAELPAIRIEILLRAGCYAEALEHCKDAPKNTFGEESSLRYREALCYEGLRKWKKAAEVYAKAATDTTVAGWARAMLGQSRCALALDDMEKARTAATRVLLRSGHYECRNTAIYAEALHLLARISVLDRGPVAAVDALDATALAWPSLRVPACDYFELLPVELPAVSPVPEPNRQTIEIHSATEARDTAISALFSDRAALTAITEISAAAGWQIQAPEEVAALLVSPVGAVDVQRIPVLELLQAICERDGVACQFRDGKIVLTRKQPATAELVAERLRRVLAVAKEHPAEAATRVTLANVQFQLGQFVFASTNYKAVLERNENNEALVAAAYNLGLHDLLQSDYSTARARFFDAIDRAPGTKWADLGWAWIARTHLDSNDPSAARRAYRRALQTESPEVASAVKLSLCLCDLLADDGDKVREVLHETRFSSRGSHIAIVEWFEALHRYRVGPTASRKEALLHAMRDAENGARFGLAGVYFAGSVYREIGMPQEACNLYEAVSDSARGPLAVRMVFDVAEHYYKINQHKLARARFLAIAALDSGTLATFAEFRLATMDVREKRHADAIRRCAAILNRPGVERTEVLALMGRAYEGLGQYRLAADCFAGRLPTP
jgi:tetratricopeptide (TPR) repeat protein